MHLTLGEKNIEITFSSLSVYHSESTVIRHNSSSLIVVVLLCNALIEIQLQL